MGKNSKTQKSSTTRRRIEIPDFVQTTNATQTTAFSIDVPASSAVYIQVRAVCAQSDYSAATMLVAEAVFRRTSAGNVVRGSTSGPVLRSLGDFTGLQPALDLVANAGTQQIDVKITGKLSATINWQFEIITLRNI